MLYTMREGHDGIQLYPIRDYNVYIYCKQCKRFVQIPEPAGYIAEVGAIGVSIEFLDLCDECIEANSAAEEEYCKTQLNPFFKNTCVTCIFGLKTACFGQF